MQKQTPAPSRTYWTPPPAFGELCEMKLLDPDFDAPEDFRYLVPVQTRRGGRE